jgi:hypothetical protein
MGDLEVIKVTYHNPKRTKWESHWEDLKVAPRVVHLVQDVELTADTELQAICLYYHHNCPGRLALSPRGVSWWNKHLSHIKALTRKLFNQAKRTGDWESYKKALTVTVRKLEKLGINVGGLRMYLTGPNS